MWFEITATDAGDFRKALKRPDFAQRLLLEVVGIRFGVAKVLDHPAQYYVEKPGEMLPIQKSAAGLVIRLHGVHAGHHSKRFFDEIITSIGDIAAETAKTVFGGFSTVRHCEIAIEVHFEDGLKVKTGKLRTGKRLPIRILKSHPFMLDLRARD